MMKNTKCARRHLRPDRIAAAGLIVFLAAGAAIALPKLLGRFRGDAPKNPTSLVSDLNDVTTTTTTETTTTTTTTTTSRYPAPATRTTDTRQLTDVTDILARNIAVIDMDSQTMLAEREADAVIEPASMTKILTIVTAVETLSEEQLRDGQITMTEEIIAPVRARQAICAGFLPGESCSVTDLLYGTILPSGADAAVALAVLTAGSEDAFVQLMNEKAAEIGMDSSHFCNATGLHAEGHVSTAHDIARLLEYAIRIPVCKEVLEAKSWRTAQTDQHPSGISLTSIVFWRLGDHTLNGIRISGGKTGFTNQAGQCLATFASDNNGKTYVCVAAGCNDPMDAVYDTLLLYNRYTGASDGRMTRPAPEETTAPAAS
ncbi:MAG: D-alanyl-D-alanine carboxypeptidase [Oscillospiraceae bacterium]|nr:D-alanyl-D-alanine carboxypeptidase [Oscillospiraceae bacterium]